ncbi:unnamed protein product [Notodromas monacha]|uniref:Importin N-terminal domain-containing protein n=1 Tax=Notodromas monacha TaxID=399045 RepID=A0A7R9BR03_9CRUS|nr:unnamed protein product [Notodromas monacha]CAG0919166.1 unnamed protein product [Notodromas monacha]
MAEDINMDVLQLELLCKQLYESHDTAERTRAEKTLMEFQNSADSLPKCRLLLERANSPYAQLLAAHTLTKLISRPTVTIPLEQRLEIRNYVLTYLSTHPNLANFVLQAMVTLFARLTKLGWFDADKDMQYVFRGVLQDTGTFLQGSVEYCIVGVRLMTAITSEMNQLRESEVTRSVTKHRKIAASFRDTHLHDIFNLSCTLLRTALGNSKNMDFNEEKHHSLMKHLLKLTLHCLTFDFIGTSIDESSDDMLTVQIPTSWRPTFLDPATLQLFFDLYAALPSSLSPLALSCIVQLASVRRSLMSNAERAKFLNHMVSGVRNILQTLCGMSDQANYHEFCRLLARLKSNYQLGELVVVDNYPEFIESIAKFTIQSLQLWQFAPNSVHYLLSLWQKMVASVPYVKATEPHLLEVYTPEVTQAFIKSRIESVPVIMKDGLEEPLDDPGPIEGQLEQISTIARLDYGKTCTLLVQLFDQTAGEYESAASIVLRSAPDSTAAVAAKKEISVKERQLTWLVYVIGAAIGGRMSFSTNDEHDSMDGELVCRVLQLMRLSDSRLPEGSMRLELAILSFMEQFRKIYVGDQVQKTSKVYRRLSETLRLNDESMVLSVFIRKIITNLRYWSTCENIVRATLSLLSDLSVGYSSVRRLVRLEEVGFLLANHTPAHFPFLGTSPDLPPSQLRPRTTFYTALGRLLLVDLGEDEDKFEQFMLPLTSAMEELSKIMLETSIVRSNEEMEGAKKALIGFARDLRGIAFAFNSKPSYAMLFDWFYPEYSAVMLKALEIWYMEPSVTTPILKLYGELVQNRSQRLHFEVSSPNGTLLFREASKAICTYGERILTVQDVPKDQEYQLRLKGMSICFSLLKNSMCGSYVNFGVFRLYGDAALENVLSIFIKMLLSIPSSELLEYPKLSQTYFVLLDCLAQDHMSFLSMMDTNVFMYLLSTISDGLSALDTMVCTSCCSALDNIITYFYKQAASKGKAKKRRLSGVEDESPVLKMVKMNPAVFQTMLQTVLNILMFEECRNQWSMSRPLLGLILLNESYFAELRSEIIGNQPVERQAMLSTCFDNLMDGVERNLLTKNRDRFTQNLSVFRRDINDSLKTADDRGVAEGRADSSEMMTL